MEERYNAIFKELDTSNSKKASKTNLWKYILASTQPLTPNIAYFWEICTRCPLDDSLDREQLIVALAIYDLCPYDDTAMYSICLNQSRDYADHTTKVLHYQFYTCSSQ